MKVPKMKGKMDIFKKVERELQKFDNTVEAKKQDKELEERINR